MSNDASRDFIDNLPELGPDETFCFDCNPDVPCFNRCCAELTLPLTPYDISRLRRNLGMSSEAFLNTFTTLRSFPDTGFPLPMLRMLDGPEEPCPFVTPAGCSVYEDRPGACRYYPIGRGTKMATDGIAERFFLVRESHCHGFDKGTSRTPHQWMENEELQPFNEANDRYMRLMALVRAGGKPLEARMATTTVLCLFQLDKFRELIEAMKIFSHVDVSESRKAAIMEDSQDGDVAALYFALDWLELMLFGQSQGLAKK